MPIHDEQDDTKFPNNKKGILIAEWKLDGAHYHGMMVA